MTKNAYIHIPFCAKKCKYCTFISVDKLTLKNIYVDALIQDISHYYENEKLNTLYIGGGTPSLLSINDFENILELFRLEDNYELTVEVNPETVDKNYLKELHNLGVNRLSIGIQSFDDNILKNIGRIHNSQTAINCVTDAQKVGFENVNIDLIYGLPNQDENNFIKSLNTALNLGIQHISLYGLKIEEGCDFFNNRPDFLPDDDNQADMYFAAIKILAENGFLHYEISNFAKDNYFSRHNLNYWNNNTYYGFGLNASGYQDNIRYVKIKNIEEYIKNPLGFEQKEKLTKEQILEEEIFLALRKNTGINVKDLNEKFDINFEKKYSDIIKKYMDYKHLEKTSNGYKLTKEGILQSNFVMSEFVSV